MYDKRKTAALVAEFFGTFVLASAVLAMAARINLSFFPAIMAGLVLMVMVLVIGPVSGAHINPAITIAFWTQRKIETVLALGYVLMQLLAGFTAWAGAQWLLDTKLNAAVQSNIDWRVLVAEALGAFIFAAGVAAAVGRKYEGGQLAAAVGFSLTIGIAVASLGSGGLLNPAVAIALHSFSTAYIVGPIVGAVLGMALYSGVLAPEFGKKKRK